MELSSKQGTDIVWTSYRQPCSSLPYIKLNFWALSLLITLVMEAIISSEASDSIYQTTRRNILEEVMLE